jgi:hypothetical protein
LPISNVGLEHIVLQAARVEVELACIARAKSISRGEEIILGSGTDAP